MIGKTCGKSIGNIYTHVENNCNTLVDIIKAISWEMDGWFLQTMLKQYW